MLVGAVEARGASKIVRVVDLSEEGCGLIGDLTILGSLVTFRRRGATSTSRVAWLGAARAGIRFDQPIEVRHMLEKVGVAAAPRHSSCRRPKLRGAHLSPAEQRSAQWCAWHLGIALPRSEP